MNGLIDKARGAPDDSDATTPQGVRSRMSLPQGMGDAYEAVITTAKKIMYSEQMKPQLTELLRSDMPVAEKLGMGATALVAMLYTQTNGTMPPQLIIPAATELVAEAADFMRKTGLEISDDDIAEGMATVVEMILGRAGITPDQIPALLQGEGGQPQPGAMRDVAEEAKEEAEEAEPIDEETADEEAPPVTPDGKPVVDTTPRKRGV